MLVMQLLVVMVFGVIINSNILVASINGMIIQDNSHIRIVDIRRT